MRYLKRDGDAVGRASFWRGGQVDVKMWNMEGNKMKKYKNFLKNLLKVLSGVGTRLKAAAAVVCLAAICTTEAVAGGGSGHINCGDVEVKVGKDGGSGAEVNQKEDAGSSVDRVEGSGVCGNCKQVEQLEEECQKVFAEAEKALKKVVAIRAAACAARDEAEATKRWTEEDAVEATKLVEQMMVSIMVLQQALESKMKECEQRAAAARSKDEAAERHLQKIQEIYKNVVEKIEKSKKQVRDLLDQLQLSPLVVKD
jgi:hypothetical protein